MSGKPSEDNAFSSTNTENLKAEGDGSSKDGNSNNTTTATTSTTTASAASTTTPTATAATDAAVSSSNKEEEHVHLHYVEPAIPSMSLSIFVFWILPVIFLAIFARFAVDTTPPPIRQAPGTNIPIKFDTMPRKPTTTSLKKKKRKVKARTGGGDESNQIGRPSGSGGPRIVRPTAPSAIPTTSTRPTWPTSYKKSVDTISRRRRKLPKRRSSGPDIPTTNGREYDNDAPAGKQKQTPRRSDDPNKDRIHRDIDRLRRDFQAHPNDYLRAIALADLLREREYHYHDGGQFQQEALDTYQHAINLVLAKRDKLVADGEPTNESLSGTKSVRDEVMLHYSVKSVDGILCSLYTNKGKVYFLSSMFEKAEEHYSKALEIEPLYLDAVGSRGSCRIILGKFAEAGQDLLSVIEHDESRFFMDAFTGIARVLAAKESAVPQGWEPVITQVNELIPVLEARYEMADNKDAKNMLGGALDRLHHVLYTYHDVKTMDTKLAWEHLTTGYNYKLATLPKWNGDFERHKLETAKQVFHKGFWAQTVGSDLEYPIFIIGFVRSGSTLLERVLDAHPGMVGLGEDSVFNGMLGYIRDTIVETSIHRMGDLPKAVSDLAHEVVAEMKKRWETLQANTHKDENETADHAVEPLHGVDKMLTNYMNVGFIHMLFPKALILHVAREPMDSVFSAFKHEFPPGTLEYTADFQAVSELYLAYREVMEHWEEVLPRRIIHIRYEDMVRDMPGMAKAIIKTTGLDWDEGVLQFHKKKHAVNTYSSTQVREGVYTKSIDSWRRYEKQLQPLVELLGERATYNLKTTLPDYNRPQEDEL